MFHGRILDLVAHSNFFKVYSFLCPAQVMLYPSKSIGKAKAVHGVILAILYISYNVLHEHIWLLLRRMTCVCFMVVVVPKFYVCMHPGISQEQSELSLS